jgi:hypothetical protein
MENEFGTKNTEEVVVKILEQGDVQESKVRSCSHRSWGNCSLTSDRLVLSKATAIQQTDPESAPRALSTTKIVIPHKHSDGAIICGSYDGRIAW